MTKAYCLKCRKLIEIKDPQRVMLRNKALALFGTCPASGTKVFRFVTRRMDRTYAAELAIEREKEAIRFYQESAARTQDANGKKMFKWLVGEESWHLTSLERQLKSLLDQKGWVDWKEFSEPLAKSEFPNTTEAGARYEATTGEVTALRTAIRAEKQAIKLYEQNAEWTSDPSGKKAFESLARHEDGHLRLLERQLEAVTKKRYYFSIGRFLNIRL